VIENPKEQPSSRSNGKITLLLQSCSRKEKKKKRALSYILSHMNKVYRSQVLLLLNVGLQVYRHACRKPIGWLCRWAITPLPFSPWLVTHLPIPGGQEAELT